MGAPRAESDGSLGGQALRRFAPLKQIVWNGQAQRCADAPHHLFHAVLADSLKGAIQFAHNPARKAHPPGLHTDALLNVRLEFLQDEDGARVTQQSPHLIGWEGIDRRDPQHRNRTPLEPEPGRNLESLLQVGGRHPRRDDAQSARFRGQL